MGPYRALFKALFKPVPWAPLALPKTARPKGGGNGDFIDFVDFMDFIDFLDFLDFLDFIDFIDLFH